MRMYSQSQVFQLLFTTLKNTGFKFFAKIMGGNYVFVVQVILALALQATLSVSTVS